MIALPLTHSFLDYVNGLDTLVYLWDYFRGQMGIPSIFD